MLDEGDFRGEKFARRELREINFQFKDLSASIFVYVSNCFPLPKKNIKIKKINPIGKL